MVFVGLMVGIMIILLFSMSSVTAGTGKLASAAKRRKRTPFNAGALPES